MPLITVEVHFYFYTYAIDHHWGSFWFLYICHWSQSMFILILYICHWSLLRLMFIFIHMPLITIEVHFDFHTYAIDHHWGSFCACAVGHPAHDRWNGWCYMHRVDLPIESSCITFYKIISLVSTIGYCSDGYKEFWSAWSYTYWCECRNEFRSARSCTLSDCQTQFGWIG